MPKVYNVQLATGEYVDVVLRSDYENLRNAAAELLEYAEDNRPAGEAEMWMGSHPITEVGKLLSE